MLELGPTSLVIECGGVGYDVRIPLSTYERLKRDSEACVYTHFYVREDELRLYGFATTAERDLFRLLLSVNGVGPSIALAALCALSPAELARAVAASDLRVLQRIKGVGRKLAQRLAVELGDRAERLLESLGVAEVPAGAEGSTFARSATAAAEDAVAALVTLGFEKKTAEEKVAAALERLRSSGGETPVGVEALIRESLRGR